MKSRKNTSLAKVKSVGVNEPVFVSISSMEKPKIPVSVVEHWQKILDSTAKLINVPAALIMKVGEKDIEVFLKNDSEKNPYKQNEKSKLEAGLYCETVVATRKPLHVSNALRDVLWDENPDIKLNMISYFGVPILWPDGECFGTFCVLDNKKNDYNSDYKDLIELYKDGVQNDLKLLSNYKYLLDIDGLNRLRYRELNHRIKNNFNVVISLIRLSKVSHHKDDEVSIDSVMNEIETKVKSISLVHEKLSLSNDLSTISLKTYLYDLIDSIIQAYDLDVSLNLDMPDIRIGDTSLVTLGLLINELVTNSVKHAFSDTLSPVIKVRVVQDGKGINVKYVDNGKGIPDSFLEEEMSLGTTILIGLSEQIGDRIKVLPSRQGFKFNILN